MELSRKQIQDEFVKKIEELSGESICACYQCGRCSAGCPLAEYMDILPHFIIRLLQLGCKEQAEKANTAWYCATCMQCTAKCPKGIDVAKIMDALREMLRRKGVDKMELEKISKQLWEKIPQQGLVSGFRKFTS